MAKAKTTEQKFITDICKEIELLAQEAHDVRQNGGNHYNVIQEIDAKTATLKKFLE